MKQRLRLVPLAALAATALVTVGPGATSLAAPMTFLADTLSDNAADGYTLREALADADANPGPDTVGFVSGLAGTITLNGTSLSSNDSLTLEGPADGSITVDGDGASRILNSFSPGSDLTVRNLTFTGGDAAFQGGAIAAYQGNDVVIESVSFVDNTTAGDGGALSIGDGTGTIDIVDSTFSGNIAAGDGGAFHLFDHGDGGQLQIERSTFVGNSATSGVGGAIRSDAGSTISNLVDVVIQDNSAIAGDAGGAHIVSDFVSLRDTSIRGNTAFDDRGGAFLRSTDGNTNLIGVEVIGNEGSEVGGVSVRSASFVNLVDTVIRDNLALSTAGARLQGDEGVNVRRTSIEDNEATAVVGGIGVIDSPEMTIEESTIRRNTAPSIGGMYVGNVIEANVRYSTVSQNRATAGDAGGVLAKGAALHSLDFSDSTLSGNEASGDGGAVYADTMSIGAYFSTIVGNVATGSGGGIFQHAGADAELLNTILTDNTAPTFANLTGPVFVEWSLLGDTTGVPFAGGGDNIGGDPLLGPLGDNGGPTATHLPSATSPVVDAGAPVVPLLDARDQRGLGRLSGPALDIGAVERVSTDGSIWTPVPPARIVDTRANGITVDGLDQAGGAFASGTETTIDVAGRAGVPDDAVGVVANVTAVRPDDLGFLTVHPCAGSLPLAASLNYSAGVTLGNEIIVGLNGSGEMCVYTSAGTHLTVDVVGYIGVDSMYTPTEPARFLETRAGQPTIDGESAGIGRLDAGEQVSVGVVNRGAVDIDARAVVMYVTAIRPDEAGFVTIWNCATERPLASSLNYVAAVNRGNEVVMTTDFHDSEVCIFTSGAVDLTVDVVGFVPDLPNNHTSLDAPVRLLETRDGQSTIDGQFEGNGMRPPGSTLKLQVAGRAGIPPIAETVTMNLTAVQPGAEGYVTAFPCNDEPPLAASLNHVPGVNGGNEIVASLDDDGRVCLFTFNATHLTADVTGYTTP